MVRGVSSCKKELEGLGLFSLEKRRLVEDHTSVHKHLRGVQNAWRQALFPDAQLQDQRQWA